MQKLANPFLNTEAFNNFINSAVFSQIIAQVVAATGSTFPLVATYKLDEHSGGSALAALDYNETTITFYKTPIMEAYPVFKEEVVPAEDLVLFVTHTIAHETLHKVLKHIPRRDLLINEPNPDDYLLFNLAADEILENLLERLKFGNLMSVEVNLANIQRYRAIKLREQLGIQDTESMTTEQLYLLLKKHAKTKVYMVPVPGCPNSSQPTGKPQAQNQNGQGPADQKPANQASNNQKAEQGDKGNQGNTPRVVLVEGVIEMNGKTLRYKSDLLIETDDSGKIKTKARKPGDLVSYEKEVLRGKLAGNTPVGLLKELDYDKNVVFDLKRYIKNYLSTVKQGFEDITFFKVNRRLSVIERKARVRMPTYISYAIRALVSLDTSGSISDKMYQEFIGAVSKSLKLLAPGSKFVLVDADVQATYDLHDENLKHKVLLSLKKRKGYGGTKIEPLLPILKQDNYDAWIHFTDAEIFDIEVLPKLRKHVQKVLFVLPVYLKSTARPIKGVQFAFYYPKV